MSRGSRKGFPLKRKMASPADPSDRDPQPLLHPAPCSARRNQARWKDFFKKSLKEPFEERMDLLPFPSPTALKIPPPAVTALRALDQGGVPPPHDLHRCSVAPPRGPILYRPFPRGAKSPRSGTPLDQTRRNHRISVRPGRMPETTRRPAEVLLPGGRVALTTVLPSLDPGPRDGTTGSEVLPRCAFSTGHTTRVAVIRPAHQHQNRVRCSPPVVKIDRDIFLDTTMMFERLPETLQGKLNVSRELPLLAL